jgi:hypothetical protein
MRRQTSRSAVTGFRSPWRSRTVKAAITSMLRLANLLPTSSGRRGREQGGVHLRRLGHDQLRQALGPIRLVPMQKGRFGEQLLTELDHEGQAQGMEARGVQRRLKAPRVEVQDPVVQEKQHDRTITRRACSPVDEGG